ncbi:MAG TPA: transcription factor FapR [Limnochorda sp.]
MTREERHQELKRLVREEPFVSDRELAQRLGVSVQTIRLDRAQLGIPQLRERTRQLARIAYSRLRSVEAGEVVGELLEMELGRRALSVLETTERMALSGSGVVRGHHLFAQANSLAVSVIDAHQALTGRARLRFLKPVRVGERVVAVATVVRSRQGRYWVEVESRVRGEVVFQGRFIVVVPGA